MENFYPDNAIRMDGEIFKSYPMPEQRLAYMRGPCGRAWLTAVGLVPQEAIESFARLYNLEIYGDIFFKRCPFYRFHSKGASD